MISMCNYGIKRNWMKIKRKSLIENSYDFYFYPLGGNVYDENDASRVLLSLDDECVL